MEIKKDEKAIHHPTERALDVLEAIAANPNSFTLSDLSKKLIIPKSTLSPILSTLATRGFISINAEMKYTIGIKSYMVGISFLKQFHFLNEAEKILTSLTDTCKETSHLAVLSGGNVLYLKKVNSPEYIRTVSSVGNQLPAYGTALGKALLINCSEQDLIELYPDGLKPLTANTITDIGVLYSQLVQARHDGYTTEIEESNLYIRCIAIPIRKEEQIIAAVSVAIPIFRYNDDKARLTLSALKETQRQLEDFIRIMDIKSEDLTL